MRRFKIFVALAVSLAVAGCSAGPRPGTGAASGPPSAGASPVAGGRLVYGLSADAAGFNPVTDQFAAQTYSMVSPIVESLVGIGADGEWKANLAESLTPNTDSDEWTIKIRPGIKFSNGDALDAEVVKANLEAQKASPLTATVFGPVKSVTVADPLTVKVSLSQAWVAFPNYLVSQVGMMVPRASLADPKKASREPVGTGPFVFKEYTAGSRMVVARNPAYWRTGLPYLDEIEFRILPDSQTRAQTLEAGGIDAMGTTRDDDITKFGAMKDAYGVRRVAGMGAPEYTFMLNTAKPPFDDIRVRKALAHATDREAFATTLRAGLTEVADGPWSKDSKWYVPGADYPAFDLAKATALIKEVEAEKGPISFTVLSVPDPNTMQGIELAQDMWRKAGADVSIKQVDQADLVNRAIVGDYEVSISVGFTSADPDGEYIRLHQSYAQDLGKISLNATRLKDTELSNALDSGRSNPQEETRKQAYAVVQQRLRELVPYIFIDHMTTGSVVYKSKVRGIGEHKLPDGSPGVPLTGTPTPYHPFTFVWLSPS
ncbi:ABC transporter substrate-binding protein [Streptosporangium soli]|nr:ABC transporter substrate-binding protein [Streptosporangium sp. KLBMP 9127]